VFYLDGVLYHLPSEWIQLRSMEHRVMA